MAKFSFETCFESLTLNFEVMLLLHGVGMQVKLEVASELPPIVLCLVGNLRL